MQVYTKPLAFNFDHILYCYYGTKVSNNFKFMFEIQGNQTTLSQNYAAISMLRHLIALLCLDYFKIKVGTLWLFLGGLEIFYGRGNIWIRFAFLQILKTCFYRELTVQVWKVNDLKLEMNHLYHLGNHYNSTFSLFLFCLLLKYSNNYYHDVLWFQWIIFILNLLLVLSHYSSLTKIVHYSF